MEDLLGIKNINSHSELDSESINLMDNKELALIDSGSESGMTRGKYCNHPTPTLPVQGGEINKNHPLPPAGTSPIKGADKAFKKAAFTLAEVLITLGVIGVVAAMTIPNLMSNIRAQQYTKKFKKVISTLANAGRMSSELYGFDFAGINSKCLSSSDLATEHPEARQSVCALLNGTLTGTTVLYGLDKLPNYNFNSSVFDSTDSFNSFRNDLPIYILSDGTIIALSGYNTTGHGAVSRGCTFNLSRNSGAGFDDGSGTYYGNGCYAMIDVNGTALPNKDTKCSNRSTQTVGILGKERGAGNCIVNNKDINDIFFVVFYDGMAEPFTNASWYVYNNSK